MVQPWVFPGWLCHQPGWLEMEKELLCPNIFLSKIGSMLLDIKVCHFYQRKLVGGPYEEGFLCLVESFGEAHHGGSPAWGVSCPCEAGTCLSESPGEDTQHFVSLLEAGDKIPLASHYRERCGSRWSV